MHCFLNILSTFFKKSYKVLVLSILNLRHMSLHSARFLFNLPSPIVFFYHGENKIFHQPALTSKIKKRIFLLSLFYQNNCLQKNLINSIEGHQPIPKSKIPDGTSLTLPVFHQNLFLQIKNKTQEDYTQPRV